MSQVLQVIWGNDWFFQIQPVEGYGRSDGRLRVQYGMFHDYPEAWDEGFITPGLHAVQVFLRGELGEEWFLSNHWEEGMFNRASSKKLPSEVANLLETAWRGVYHSEERQQRGQHEAAQARILEVQGHRVIVSEGAGDSFTQAVWKINPPVQALVSHGRIISYGPPLEAVAEAVRRLEAQCLVIDEPADLSASGNLCGWDFHPHMVKYSPGGHPKGERQLLNKSGHLALDRLIVAVQEYLD